MECAICLSDIEPQYIRTLECGGPHSFHKVCVDIWLQRQPTCPICRDVVGPRPHRSDPRMPWLPPIDYNLITREVTQVETRPGRNLDALATALGLSPIHDIPPEYIFSHVFVQMQYHYVWRISESQFGISTQLNCDWVPEGWINYSRLLSTANRDQHRAFQGLNIGVPGFIITSRFQPPQALRICRLCNLFITNSVTVWQLHAENFHEGRDPTDVRTGPAWIVDGEEI